MLLLLHLLLPNAHRDLARHGRQLLQPLEHGLRAEAPGEARRRCLRPQPHDRGQRGVRHGARILHERQRAGQDGLRQDQGGPQASERVRTEDQ